MAILDDNDFFEEDGERENADLFRQIKTLSLLWFIAGLLGLLMVGLFFVLTLLDEGASQFELFIGFIPLSLPLVWAGIRMRRLFRQVLWDEDVVADALLPTLVFWAGVVVFVLWMVLFS